MENGLRWRSKYRKIRIEEKRPQVCGLFKGTEMQDKRLWVLAGAIAVCLVITAALYCAASAYWILPLCCGVLLLAVSVLYVRIRWKSLLTLPTVVGMGVLKGTDMPERRTRTDLQGATDLWERLAKEGFSVSDGIAIRGKSRFILCDAGEEEAVIAFAAPFAGQPENTVIVITAEMDDQQARRLTHICGPNLVVVVLREHAMYWTEGLAPLSGGTVKKAVSLARRYGM